MAVETFSLAPLFQAVGQALEDNRHSLNLADSYNGNHGDHMVRIFLLAAQAAEAKQGLPPAEGMQLAACLLEKEKQNGSAQVYSRGLSCIAEQFRTYEVTVNDLVNYIQGVLVDKQGKSGEAGISHQSRKSGSGFSQVGEEIQSRPTDESSSAKSGKILKALASGLAAWGKEPDERNQKGSSLDIGSLFEFGMAYLQAKQRGGSKIEVLADAAASVSPLSRVPHRYLSGKIAIQALLQAIQNSSAELAG